ncbi:MAG: hypothetical protein HZB51_03660 [Chloroflexi bacterium]|nr:hypothetical protein [Chloroflexota bacterium]
MDIGQIFAFAFWASLALSTLIAVVGVWRAQRWFLVASAILSIPFVFFTVAHPGVRYFVGLPILHILAAIAVKGYPRWMSWALLFVIVSLAAVFLVILFGVV